MRRRAAVLVAMAMAATALAQDASGRRPKAEGAARVAEVSARFWAAPSLGGFVDVATAMDQSLSVAQHEHEIQTGDSSRPRVADFEKMKQRLAAGVRSPMFSPSAAADATDDGAVARAQTAFPLPGVRPSFFRTGDILYAQPLGGFTVSRNGTGPALVDALSAAHGAMFTVRSWKPAGEWSDGHLGMWDVSAGSVQFDRPVTIHGVTGAGAPTGFLVTSLVTPLGVIPCTGSPLQFRGRYVNPGWLSAIVAWVGKPPERRGTVSSVDISTRTKYGKRTAQSIDLDADGVADFVIYAGVAPPVVQYETMWKMLYVNLEGKWLPLGFAQESDCT